MIKRYSSPCVKFTINVKKNGKQTEVVFDRYNQDTKRRFIDIKDVDTQNQIENSPAFNVYFSLDFSIPDPDEQKAKDAELEQVHFEGVKDAKAFVNDKGIPFHRLTNAKQIIEEGKLLGYNIEITPKK